MNQEIEWYRTPHDNKEEGVSGYMYRAIRWDKESHKYFLIANHNNPGISGSNDAVTILFEDPKILADALVTLAVRNATNLRGKGTVTRTHQEWDHSQTSPIDTDLPDDIQTGEVSLSLSVTKDGSLAPFESTVQVIAE